MNEVIKNAREIIQSYDGPPVRIMEVCGTHTHEIFRLGIRSLLPETIDLISGPGCPVCVTAVGYIDEAIYLAKEKGCVICTFGDLIKVPGTKMSLAGARAEGADVRPVYSPDDAVELAKENPEMQVVFLAVGFETTTPSACLAVKKAKKLKVRIPEGIDDGQTIVLKGEGEPGKNGGPNGDLYIVVRVKKDSIYSRRAEHVLCEVPITFTMATLGGEIEIPMVDGSKERYRIPEGTATNTKFSIKNKGFKSLNGNWRGDFVFTVIVQVPKKLTIEQRNLLVELAKTMNEQPPLKKRGIFG